MADQIEIKIPEKIEEKIAERIERDGERRRWKRWHGGGSSGAIYGFGLLGSLFYFLQHSTSFADGLVGIIKAIAWPALLVYKALEQLKF